MFHLLMIFTTIHHYSPLLTILILLNSYIDQPLEIFTMIHHYSLLFVVYSNFMFRDIHHSFHFFITIVYYSLLNLSKLHSLNVMDLPWPIAKAPRLSLPATPRSTSAPRSRPRRRRPARHSAQHRGAPGSSARSRRRGRRRAACVFCSVAKKDLGE